MINNLSGILLAVVLGLSLVCYAMFESIQNKNEKITTLENSVATMTADIERLNKVDKSNQTIMSDLFNQIDENESEFDRIRREFAENKCNVRIGHVNKPKIESKGDVIPPAVDGGVIDFTVDRKLFDKAACAINNDCKP